jgi:putative ABC transport system substrate-binding protein
MNRRQFITLLGAMTASPWDARAQTKPLVGFLSSSAPGETIRLTAFHRGLADMGFTEDRNLAIDFRYAEGQYARLGVMAKELVGRNVAVILASALPSALAAKNATNTIPIVFVSGADPVQLGLVESLNRPGANVTGISNYFGALGGKRLELLLELVPKAALIGYLLNPSNQNAEAHSAEVREAARVLGRRIEVLTARNSREVDAAFARLPQLKAGALLIGDDPFYATQRDRMVALAARHAVPTSYYSRDFVDAGGLISYGSSQSETYRLGGMYVGRILKGERPSELPVVQPTKFELVINLKTAKALGVTVPPTLLASADEVIE